MEEASNMILVACDPGKSGAIVVRDMNGDLHSFRTRDRKEVYEAFLEIDSMRTYDEDLYHEGYSREVYDTTLYLEDVHYTHRDGKKQVWSFSAAVERILMAAEMYGIPVKLVSPQKWQEALGLKNGKSDLNGGKNKKRTLCDAAQEMYLDEDIYLWNADAYLILRYGEMCERK